MEAGTRPSPDCEFVGHGFRLNLRGALLDLTMVALNTGESAPTFNEVFFAAAGFPVDLATPQVFMDTMKRGPGRATTVGHVEFPGDRAQWKVRVSPNRMFAYLIPGTAAGPATGEEAPATPVAGEAVLEQLAFLDVKHGVREDVLARFTPEGSASLITVVAEGTRPVPATDARVELAFDPSSPAIPTPKGDGSVDYHLVAASPNVAVGDVVARRIPPIVGVPGTDVLGKPVNVKAPAEEPLTRILGAGTSIRGDELYATKTGRPVLRGGKVEVLPIFEVKGDVSYSVGNIRFNGDVVIHGDVLPGFRVEAEGSVTVRGIVDRATIIAAQDVIAGAIVGDPKSRIEAGRNLRTQYAHFVTMKVEGELIVNRELIDCTVVARRIQSSGNGRIVGGDATAHEEIVVGTVGSLQAGNTQVTVLHRPGNTPAVIRVSGITHSGSVIRVGYSLMRIVDSFTSSSYWDGRGEMIRLGTTSPAPDGAKPAPAAIRADDEPHDQALAS